MSENNRNCGKYITTNLASPVADDKNTLTVGNNGPGLLQDVQFIEKLAHFDRERIPERVVHAKGVGAHGYFQCYNCMAKYTKASFLQDPKRKTPVFVRFSTVIGSKGSADTVRDPRGFATKFYTDEGNFDLVGNDLPVFFIRDAIQFPDVIHSLKPSPDTNTKIPERFWDFISRTPEAMHMIMWLYSDRGTIKSYRKIEGFGVNTFILVNEAGCKNFVKFHWKPKAGIETITRQEAEYLAGVDPDIAVKDLYYTIKRGQKVEFEMCIQVMPIENEYNYDFDPLDDTKTWPEDIFPLIPVGLMTLNRNPMNFFAEVEQAAFCPANIVPGIDFSADKMLVGRTFSYSDTQRHRIGPNFDQLPINSPKAPIVNNQQDGAMRYFAKGGPFNYSPNTLNQNMPRGNEDYRDKNPLFIEGKMVKRPISLQNDFKQAGDKYRSYNKMEKEHLVDNIAVEIKNINPRLQHILIGYFEQVDEELAMKLKQQINKKDNCGCMN